jgi:hypothetical protein
MCPMYNELEAVIAKDDDEAPTTAAARSGRTYSSGCTFCAGMDGSKTSMGTSTSREDAVSTAWSSNAKKNFATRVLVLELVRRFLGGLGQCWRHAVCELMAGQVSKTSKKHN